MKQLCLAVALVWAVSSSCAAGTVVVDCTGGGDFLTVQEGVDAAATGDTVLIRPCVYAERVVVAGKALTLRGSGPDVTRLEWSSLVWEEALRISLVGGGYISTVESLAIVRHPVDHPAVHVDDHTLVVHGCAVTGGVSVGTYYGEARVDGSRLTQLSVQGGVRTSVVSNSRIGSAYFSGCFGRPAPQSVMSFDSEYGSVGFGSLVGITSERDSIGVIGVSGAPDACHYVEANASTIACLLATGSAYVELHGCTLGDVSYESDPIGVPFLTLTHCLVRGPLTLHGTGANAATRRASAVPTTGRGEGLLLEHNTLLSELEMACVWGSEPRDRRIRDNIVLGATELDLPDNVVIAHNDFVSGADISTPSDSVFANLEADPLFCGLPEVEYTIEDCSPCAGAAHDGTDIGAFGVACSCTAVQGTSWGAVKAMFRQVGTAGGSRQ